MIGWMRGTGLDPLVTGLVRHHDGLEVLRRAAVAAAEALYSRRGGVAKPTQAQAAVAAAAPRRHGDETLG